MARGKRGQTKTLVRSVDQANKIAAMIIEALKKQVKYEKKYFMKVRKTEETIDFGPGEGEKIYRTYVVTLIKQPPRPIPSSIPEYERERYDVIVTNNFNVERAVGNLISIS